jgi:hypothetical protein
VFSYRWRALYRLATPSAAIAVSTSVSPINATRSERAIERRCMPASVSLPIDGNRAGRGAVAVTIRSMSLARAWTRQLYGASGAALLVPGAILLALALLGLAGGFGQLGTLSQAFAGPAVPGGSTVAGGVVSARAAAPVLPIARGGAPAPLLAAARAGAGAGARRQARVPAPPSRVLGASRDRRPAGLPEPAAEGVGRP